MLLRPSGCEAFERRRTNDYWGKSAMSDSIYQGAPAELWQALVREAAQRTGYLLDEYRESYLVFVLLQRQRDAYFLCHTQALSWFHAHQNSGSLRLQALRDIGDECLLISGLFPGLAQKRRVAVDYYVELGQSAYSAVAQLRASDSELFCMLAASYVELVRTLRALRPHASDIFLSQHSAANNGQKRITVGKCDRTDVERFQLH